MGDRITLQQTLGHLRIELVAVAIAQAEQLHPGARAHAPARVDHHGVGAHQLKDERVEVGIDGGQIRRASPGDGAARIGGYFLEAGRGVVAAIIAQPRLVLATPHGRDHVTQHQLLHVVPGAPDQLIAHRDQGDDGLGRELHVIEAATGGLGINPFPHVAGGGPTRHARHAQVAVGERH
ncbi:hypothetical protein D3C87_930270 [compost metagenome]